MLVGTRHANVWEETAVAPPVVPPLDGAHTASVLVVGAGYLGLSAALHLAQAGVDVLVVDAEVPGWGASGRNGGQVIPGLKYDPGELEAMFGRERGERIWRFAGATADFVFDLVARHGLDCGARRATWIQGIHSEKAAGRARQRVDDWAKRGAPVEYLEPRSRSPPSPAPTSTSADSPTAGQGRCSRCPTCASSRAWRSAFGRPCSRRRAGGRRSMPTGSGWRAVTASGATVRADTVLIATNAYADGLVPGLARSIVALNSLQIATAPIPPSLRRTLLPNGETLSDTRRVIRYWRLDDEGRLADGRPRPVPRVGFGARLGSSRARRAHAFPGTCAMSRSRTAGAGAWRCTSITCRACIGRNRSF